MSLSSHLRSRAGWAGCCFVLLLAGSVRGQEEGAEPPDLRQIVARQQKQIAELARRVKAGTAMQAPGLLPDLEVSSGPSVQLDDAGVEEGPIGEEDLRQVVARQQEQIEELGRRIDAMPQDPALLQRLAQKVDPLQPGKGQPPVSAPELEPNPRRQPRGSTEEPAPETAQQAPAETKPLSRTDVQSIISSFLKENPGIGMPAGVQTGFEAGNGFFIRSAPNPAYVRWQDQSRIPFELRIRGRAQIDYYFYKVTDNLNHLTGQRYEPEVGDFSQIEAKRVRLFWEGTAFTPDLRYQLQIDGNTRGLGGFQNNRDIQTTGTSTPAAAGAGALGGASPSAGTAAPGIGGTTSAIGGGVTVDHALRLFTAWIAYDVPLRFLSKGCGPNCPDGTTPYTPLLTFVVGKQQPFFGLTEILGSANAQFVDFSMADWYFDADDNNMLTAATVQFRGFEDRLFATALITNGNESQFPNTQMDRLPGFNAGFWYDLGGSWNNRTKSWTLFGNSISDLDFTLRPTVRLGGAVDLVPMDRRSIYGDDEQSRVLVTPGGPGGTRLINLLDGANNTGSVPGAHTVDKFDYYAYDAFVAFHYRGLSLYNEWWFRNLNNFHTNHLGNNQIIYQDGSGANALFPVGGLFDYGTAMQSGYFFVPKKLELIARYSWISGNSGDINGTGRFTATTVAGVAGPVRVIDGAFRNFHEASELAFGYNYYFYGQLVKWSTDWSLYRGGNPAAGGSSPAGFLPGVDGWMVRTQIQLAF